MKPTISTATFLLLLAALLLAGCSSISTRKVIDLAPFKHIYVVHRLTDDHHLDELFVRELQSRGHDAYEDRWAWDFKSYLIELDIDLRTARTDKKLADGRYNQPTIKTKPPAEVIHELLVSLMPATGRS